MVEFERIYGDRANLFRAILACISDSSLYISSQLSTATAACSEVGPVHHEQLVLGQFLRPSESSAELGVGNSRKLA